MNGGTGSSASAWPAWSPPSALALVVVVLVNARKDRRQAREARVGELAAIAERELVHDPVAAAIALLEGLEIEPGSTRAAQLAGRLLGAPARDVVRVGDEVQLLGVSAGDRLAATVQSNRETPIRDTAHGPRLRDAAERGGRRHPERRPGRGPESRSGS